MLNKPKVIHALMRVIVDIPPDQYERVLTAIRAGRAVSVSQFLRYAIENQLALEEHGEGLLGSPTSPGGSYPKEANVLAKIPSDPWAGLHVDDIRWEDLPRSESPSHLRNELIWGQYNRLFPLKVAARVLAQLQLTKNGKVSLHDFHARASEVATEARYVLESFDLKNETPRGGRLAAAFPEHREKSVERFKGHFLGYLRTDGTAVGALPELGFVNISSDSNSTTALSDVGVQFAQLRNPIVDDNNYAGSAFSPDEVSFLINHLRKRLPKEHDYVTRMASWISEGDNTPDTLLRRVQMFNPNWTKKVANTMRSGAIARMQELDLVSLTKEGLHVSYTVTPSGLSMLEGGKSNAPTTKQKM